MLFHFGTARPPHGRTRRRRANEFNLDDLHAELAEIDENLIRCNLTPAQEAAAIFRRKFIYEKLHPETKAGTAGANARWNASDNLSFASSTSDATGKDKRTVERAAARGEALGDDLNDIAGTSLDNGVELDALRARERKRIIECAKAGVNVSARITKIDGEALGDDPFFLMRSMDYAG